MRIIENAEGLTTELLSQWLGVEVLAFDTAEEGSNWAKHIKVTVTTALGVTKAIRIKCVLGGTFSQSECDYYTKDYSAIVHPPFPNIYAAAYSPEKGYFIVMDDLSDTHTDRKLLPPTRDHAFALVDALAALHRCHWECGMPPSDVQIEHYLKTVSAGAHSLATASGDPGLLGRIGLVNDEVRARWRNPKGMTLLHGDANPTNVLTPKGADGPVLLIDRQPFDWSLTYGPGVYDIAYATTLWWDSSFWMPLASELVAHWHAAISPNAYSLTDAMTDWDLAVRQCIHVPCEWCSDPQQGDAMRWLWSWQLRNLGFLCA